MRDKLKEAKPKWIAMDYGVIEKFASRDFGAAFYWNGAALRSRKANPDVRFGYPKEGFPFFMDSVAILKDAKNVDNAKLFMNFIMDPENAAAGPRSIRATSLPSPTTRTASRDRRRSCQPT